ncbi:hypothetical protein [Ornithinimicrobium kibberense]|uniref:hypothetical protein n=1 Tax=Ornithinimicrobium kibberense TaxID=282060 RepID=UPI00360BE0E2
MVGESTRKGPDQLGSRGDPGGRHQGDPHKFCELPLPAVVRGKRCRRSQADALQVRLLGTHGW